MLCLIISDIRLFRLDPLTVRFSQIPFFRLSRESFAKKVVFGQIRPFATVYVSTLCKMFFLSFFENVRRKHICEIICEIFSRAKWLVICFFADFYVQKHLDSY
jgi:hypothetical protein